MRITRQGSWHTRCGKLLGLATIALLLVVWTSTYFVFAVPHTISKMPHPFDPDWLDLKLVLNQKCAKCHRPGTDRTDLTTYEALMAAKGEHGTPLVVPGKPEESLLWEYVIWNVRAEADSDLPESPLMPPELHEWLTDGQLKFIHRWIANGALEYKLPPHCSPRPLLEIDFPSARECKACHPKQYEEWSRSMHAYAQHSPIMEAFQLTLVERTSGTIGTFCTRCHTPLGVALGENGSRRNVHRSRLSMEGITCVVCHRVKQPYYKASTRHHIEPGALIDGCMYGPFDDPVSTDGTHPAKGKPYIKQSAFCGSCHDVTNPQGVRLEEAFSEWQNSPAAKEGITCQMCHMGPVQGLPIPENHRPLGRAAVVPGVDPKLIPLRHLTDHTFAGPDYSLLPDTEFPHKLDWMYEVDYRDASKLTPYQRKTLDDLRRINRKQLRIATEKRYELLRNAAKITVCAPQRAARGAGIGVRVDVTSKVAGHNFPTGFTAERQAWVSVILRDPCGKVVFASGDVDKNNDLRDEHSHYVEAGKIPRDKHLLNFQSKFISLLNRGTERAVIISVNRHLTPVNIIRPAAEIASSFGRPGIFRVQKASLAPLSTAARTYPIALPTRPGPYFLEVRLNYRHLPPSLFDKIGTSHLKRLLEIVVIDEHRQVIHVGQASNLPLTR